VPLVGHLVKVARDLARSQGIADGGYRLVINNGVAAGQTVFHFHVHLMGGRTFQWPPG
jgi:histidine triad (HIT) family protein